MRHPITLLTLAGALAVSSSGFAQSFQSVLCYKAKPGKQSGYRGFFSSTTKKMAQAMLDGGEVAAFTLLQAVSPQGAEAKCDFIISVLHAGAAPTNLNPETLGKAISKAGLKMTYDEYMAKRDTFVDLVSSETWMLQSRAGAPAVGHYGVINWMKVMDARAQRASAIDIWKPMQEEIIKQGARSGWVYATPMFPGGADAKYGAMTADIYPSFDAVFKPISMGPIFAKVHPGKNAAEVNAASAKARTIVRTELFQIVERIAK